MDEPPRSGRPRLALLRRRLPYAERDEVVTDLAAEYRVRVARDGGVAG
ncbi:MAG: hypothetical protein IRZ00_16285, partial [Gemmatimonadetes bacterium]|nr:hypothetical protein [Gemmatimonadota bacterium]